MKTSKAFEQIVEAVKQMQPQIPPEEIDKLAAQAYEDAKVILRAQ